MRNLSTPHFMSLHPFSGSQLLSVDLLKERAPAWHSMSTAHLRRIKDKTSGVTDADGRSW